jgi:long-chain acyl-CoA synthetase
MFAHETGVKKTLVDWALGVGGQVAAMREQGEQPSGLLSVQHTLADRLVLSKVRERFGGRVKFFISGSAALNPDVARWFSSVGLLIIEGYGLTETSAATCVNRPRLGRYIFGSVGWPLPGTQVRTADDGELLVKGPGVMRGYHNRPDATAEVFTEDGWFHTGDIGTVDERGFVKITDRKKDLFKTSGGKYVAPQQLEFEIQRDDLVEQAVIIGESRPYVTALIVPDWAGVTKRIPGRPEDLIKDERVIALIEKAVDGVNKRVGSWEAIKYFTLLPRAFTEEAGEITPTLKIKRKVVAQRYSDQIESMYERKK